MTTSGREEDIKWNATEAPTAAPASDSMRVTETTGLSAEQPPWMAITPGPKHPPFDMELWPGWDWMPWQRDDNWWLAGWQLVDVTVYGSVLIVGPPLPLCICNRAFRKLIQFMLILWQITRERAKSPCDFCHWHRRECCLSEDLIKGALNIHIVS